MSNQETYRSRSARITAGAMVIVSIAATSAHVMSDGLRVAAPTVGLAILACTAAVFAYWIPSVRVSPTEVTVVNVFRTIRVPWAHVVHVDTRWAMELLLDSGKKVSAFAAPAPGTFKARRFSTADVHGLPADTYALGSVRVGDSPGTASGDAAIVVRTALAAWRDAHPDSRPDDGGPVMRHTNVAAAVGLSLAVCIAIAGFVF